MIYGNPPVDLGHFDPDLGPVFFYLYLPVSLKNTYKFCLPSDLKPLESMLDKVYGDNFDAFYSKYIYITAKRMIIGPSISPNRPGWHSDGFMSNDLNYIWCDTLPTVFNDGPFNIDLDHVVSLRQFEDQAKPQNDYRLPVKHLLKLDDKVIHRVDSPTKIEMRTFVKISVSDQEYNLFGNSINHELDYKWTYHKREDIRNDPHKAQGDFK